MICPQCKQDVEILTPGKYAIVLTCNHVITSMPLAESVKHGASGVQAAEISESRKKIEDLPKIDTSELIERAIKSLAQTQEEFFTSENLIIEDLIKEHGKANASLMLIAIHHHMSRVLFTMNRFRNFYYTQIESMRKEVEDKAVKELIQNQDFYYTPSDKKPKKIKTALSKTGTDIDKAKEALGQLRDKDGNPLDVTKVLANLMWKSDSKKDKEKADYQAGLDKIKESIAHKE